MKILCRTDLIPLAEALSTADDWKQEIAVLERLKGKKHCVQLLTVAAGPQHTHLVMEKVVAAESVDGTSRSDAFDVLRNIAPAIVSAVVELHEAGVVHRNINPHNVLLSGGPARAVLCGFGQASLLGTGGDGNPRAQIAPLYLPPEYFYKEQAGFGPASDVWAAAAVILRLLTGAPPLDGIAGTEEELLTAAGEALCVQRRAPAVPDWVPADVAPVLRQCFEFDETLRPSPLALRDALARHAAGAREAPAPPEPAPGPGGTPSSDGADDVWSPDWSPAVEPTASSEHTPAVKPTASSDRTPAVEPEPSVPCTVSAGPRDSSPAGGRECGSPKSEGAPAGAPPPKSGTPASSSAGLMLEAGAGALAERFANLALPDFGRVSRGLGKGVQSQIIENVFKAVTCALEPLGGERINMQGALQQGSRLAHLDRVATRLAALAGPDVADFAALTPDRIKERLTDRIERGPVGKRIRLGFAFKHPIYGQHCFDAVKEEVVAVIEEFLRGIAAWFSAEVGAGASPDDFFHRFAEIVRGPSVDAEGKFIGRNYKGEAWYLRRQAGLKPIKKTRLAGGKAARPAGGKAGGRGHPRGPSPAAPPAARAPAAARPPASPAGGRPGRHVTHGGLGAMPPAAPSARAAGGPSSPPRLLPGPEPPGHYAPVYPAPPGYPVDPDLLAAYAVVGAGVPGYAAAPSYLVPYAPSQPFTPVGLPGWAPEYPYFGGGYPPAAVLPTLLGQSIPKVRPPEVRPPEVRPPEVRPPEVPAAPRGEPRAELRARRGAVPVTPTGLPGAPLPGRGAAGADGPGPGQHAAKRRRVAPATVEPEIVARAASVLRGIRGGG